MQHRINIAGVASAADWTTSISLAISFSLTHATTSLLAFSPLTSRTYPASRYYREQSLECFSLSTTTKFSDLPIYQLWLHVCSLCRRFSRVFTKVGFSCAPYDYGSSLSCFWVRFCAFFYESRSTSWDLRRFEHTSLCSYGCCAAWCCTAVACYVTALLLRAAAIIRLETSLFGSRYSRKEPSLGLWKAALEGVKMNAAYFFVCRHSGVASVLT